MSDERIWKVYLAGEIHSDWRERLKGACSGLPVRFTAPVTDHPASDAAGTGTLGPEQEKFWADHKGAGVNSIRTQTAIGEADLVVVRFGDRYRQWNAAFDAGYATGIGKPVVTLHDEEFDHALKEIDAAARGTARTPEQVAAVLRYVIDGVLPG
ncbi:MAG: YtoQ family protein [Solirubrobacterales bacterium]|nr:YtoQ family protein [Solirubrobacterales bacterium]